jgi:hypothetical protein
MADRREGPTEAEKASWAIRWEQMRVGHFTHLGHTAKAQHCQQLVEAWQQRRAELFEEAQRG